MPPPDGMRLACQAARGQRPEVVLPEVVVPEVVLPEVVLPEVVLPEVVLAAEATAVVVGDGEDVKA